MAVITDNKDRNRFEMPVEGRVAYVDYRQEPERLVLLYAKVPEELEGRGVGKELVRGVLDEVRRRGVKIVPRCGFIAAFIRRNREYADLVA